MKNDNPIPAGANLGDLLHGARISPPLPPRFQENVWRRIENAGAPATPASWLDVLVALVLRPRFAVAAVTVLVLAGAFMGAMQGRQNARHEAQARYVASVAPAALR
jgi:hypothetical protein